MKKMIDLNCIVTYDENVQNLIQPSINSSPCYVKKGERQGVVPKPKIEQKSRKYIEISITEFFLYRKVFLVFNF